MRKLLFVFAIALLGIACEKEEICFKSTRIFVEGDVVVQEFEDGTTIELAKAGENYNAFKNTCEL